MFNTDFFPIIDLEGTAISKNGHINFLESEAEQGFIHNDFDCSNCSI